MNSCELLRTVIQDSYPALMALKEQDSVAAMPGKWCPKQIIGHLIDSACNNHSRFVRAQFGEELIFPGYEQERWVRAQACDQVAWADLLALWRSYNLHLAHIVSSMPSEQLHKPRPRHTLDPEGWRDVLQHDPITLDHFVRDYIRHLEHHLRQILSDYPPKAGRSLQKQPEQK